MNILNLTRNCFLSRQRTKFFMELPNICCSSAVVLNNTKYRGANSPDQTGALLSGLTIVEHDQ